MLDFAREDWILEPKQPLTDQFDLWGPLIPIAGVLGIIVGAMAAAFS